jgi:glycosyltransferase involved in cell wall biosynthesis
VAIRNFLLEHGNPCEVINITRHRRADTDGIYYPKNAAQLIRLLLLLRYDVIHLHIGGELTLRLLGLSLVCCMKPGSKSVLTFHSGGYASSPAATTARPRTLRGLVLRRFNGLIAVNREIADLLGRFGIPAAKIRLIPPHSVSAPGPEVALPTPLERFFQQHDPRLIAVARLEPEYDLPMQIDMMKALLKRHPRAGLAILGSGSLQNELRDCIARKPYRNQILLCGDVAHATTLRAIEQSDLLLRTTLYDGDSIAVHEALALGTPVIATDNGMRPPGVRLVAAHDSNRLLTAIEAELSAGCRRRQMEVDPGKNLRAVVQFYLELFLDRKVSAQKQGRGV